VTSEREFVDIALSNPLNRVLHARLATLGLPQCYLVAGCLYQTFWNWLDGRPLNASIKDYDVFYFQPEDLSWDAEDAVIRRVHAATRDLGVEVEVKNQARVHLWYEQRFGHAQAPLRSIKESIESYLVACTCVGLNVESGELHAPFGFAELAAGHLRKNPRRAVPDDLFQSKAASYCARWPWLRVVE
jgi:uncharacterized protein